MSYEEVLASYSDGYFSRYSVDQVEGGRDSIYNHILTVIGKRKGVGTILDVGTGCGYFIDRAQKKGWIVKGIEPSSKAVDYAGTDKSLDIFVGTLKEYSGNDRFDVITFINVLDHSAAPWEEIERARQFLKPGGIIYIRFPNGLLHSSVMQMASKCGLSNCVRNYLVFHQFSFTPKFIKKLLSDSNLSAITIFNSPPSEGDPHNLFRAYKLAQYVKGFLYSVAMAVQIFTFGRLLLGTSLEVTAKKT